MNQLKAGAVLNYVVLGLNNLVGLLYVPFMLRMMGQSEYGLYSLVASVIAYLTIMDFGFGNAIVRYTAKFRAENKLTEQYSLFGMFLTLYTAIGLAALVGGVFLYLNVDTLFGATMTAYELGRARLLTVILIFNLAISFPLGVFGSIVTAYEDFVFQKVVQIARIVLNTVVMIYLLKAGYKAVAMVIVQTAFNLGTLLLNLFYCKYRIGIKVYFKQFDWSLLKEVAIYSFWIFLNAIMDRIYWNTGQFVLGALVGTAAVAVFAIAIQMQTMYMSFSTAISNVLLPRITSISVQHGNEKTLSDLFIRTGRIQYIVLAFILSGFILFGRQFIALWAGPGYEGAYLTTVLFMIALTVPLIQNVGIAILQARNQMRFRSLLYIVIALSSLVFQIALAKILGGLGCAIAISAALLLGQGVIMNIYYQRVQHIDIGAFWAQIARMSLVPVGLAIPVWFVLQRMQLSTVWSLGGGIIFYSVLYIPLFWFFCMNDYERSLLKTPFLRLRKRLCHD